jgi:uncharacterized protein YhbP (UPF0306 family)
MTDDARARALDYLRECHVMTLATYGSEGLWAAAVFYAPEGFTLHFLSSRASRHARNLARNPRAAATIQRDYDDWPPIKGVQLEGDVRELDGEPRAHALRLYAERFPVVRNAARAPAAIARALANVSWYALVPERLYFVDNAIGFGHRDEIDVRL